MKYIEKSLKLIIKVPETFSECDELNLDEILSKAISKSGYEVMDSAPYKTVEVEKENY